MILVLLPILAFVFLVVHHFDGRLDVIERKLAATDKRVGNIQGRIR